MTITIISVTGSKIDTNYIKGSLGVLRDAIHISIYDQDVITPIKAIAKKYFLPVWCDKPIPIEYKMAPPKTQNITPQVGKVISQFVNINSP